MIKEYTVDGLNVATNSLLFHEEVEQETPPWIWVELGDLLWSTEYGRSERPVVRPRLKVLTTSPYILFGMPFLGALESDYTAMLKRSILADKKYSRSQDQASSL